MNIPSAESIRNELASLASQMSDPATAQNSQRMKSIARQHASQEELLKLVEKHEETIARLAEAETLIGGDDNELAAMAEDEQTELQTQRQQLERSITALLIPHDPKDDRDVIIEIRAGAGGDEASLFALELFRAYTRYAETHGWKMHVISSATTETGGYKEVVAELTGESVFGTFKFERGVHRVQRVPETEKQGRVHTSTITVAVLPQAEEVDIEIKPEDLRIDTYRASGAGGQHVNKTSSAIRITHLPTNTVVAVQDERSQHKNKEKAFSILRARLLEAQEDKQRQQAASSRKAQVGTGDRSEKIRTYNFPQDRITDHRIKESWSNIEGVMAGELDPLFSYLTNADRDLKIAQL